MISLEKGTHDREDMVRSVPRVFVVSQAVYWHAIWSNNGKSKVEIFAEADCFHCNCRLIAPKANVIPFAMHCDQCGRDSKFISGSFFAFVDGVKKRLSLQRLRRAAGFYVSPEKEEARKWRFIHTRRREDSHPNKDYFDIEVTKHSWMRRR